MKAIPLLLTALGLCYALPLTSQFTGGIGDGHDGKILRLSIQGYDASGLFAGGNGDGYDASTLLLSIQGYDATGLFTGGIGDGHDSEGFTLSIQGYDASGLFAGGNGDGHDVEAFTLSIQGYDATGLFTGGNGDGHDSEDFTLSIQGYDASGIFAGGDGDGHDKATFIGSLLPLTLISFEAIPQEKFVLLKWVTTDEQDTDYFTIEKTKDGRDYTQVNLPLDAAGFSEPGEELHYETRDDTPWAGTSFYRLKATDFDGSFSLSALQEVSYASTADWDFLLFPNPNDGSRLGVRLQAAPKSALHLEIFTADGKQVLKQRLLPAEGSNIRLDLPNHRLAAGNYLVRIQDATGTHKSKLLLVAPRR